MFSYLSWDIEYKVNVKFDPKSVRSTTSIVLCLLNDRNFRKTYKEKNVLHSG